MHKQCCYNTLSAVIGIDPGCYGNQLNLDSEKVSGGDGVGAVLKAE